jgi:cytochrome c oxidase subunit 1
MSGSATPERPLSGAAKRELWAWCFLAISALAVAGVFAILLAVSRLPGIEDVFPWPLAFFEKGLVIHVVYSFVVWFLAVFGALSHLATQRVARATPRANGLGMAGVAMVAVASVLLFIPALLDRGEASLNNYVPVIVDPLYYAGLVLLAGGVALAAVRLVVNLPGRRPVEPVAFGVAAATAAYGVALVCVALAFWLSPDEAPTVATNEDLFWGAGHVLQFVNTALMLGAWYLLGASVLGRPPMAPGWHKGAALWLLAFTLPAPVLYLVQTPFGADQTEMFTSLQYALAPPVLVVAGLIAGTFAGRGAPPPPWRHPGFLCLVLSVGVFAVGGVLGLFVNGADTRTPAHYHGVIAGVNLAFMGLFYVVFLPLLGRGPRWGRMLYAQVALFAGGQTVAALGLFWAGGYGAPRKTAGAEQGLDGIGAIAGMALNGVGALVAVIGGVLFIWTVARALLGPPAGTDKFP